MKPQFCVFVLLSFITGCTSIPPEKEHYTPKTENTSLVCTISENFEPPDHNLLTILTIDKIWTGSQAKGAKTNCVEIDTGHREIRLQYYSKRSKDHDYYFTCESMDLSFTVEDDREYVIKGVYHKDSVSILVIDLKTNKAACEPKTFPIITRPDVVKIYFPNY